MFLALTVIAATPAAFGHEFWIAPFPAHTTAGSIVHVGLHVGDGFPGHPVARDRERFERFVVAGPEGTTPVAGWDGRHPAGLARVDTPGIHVIGYESRPQGIELDAAAFESYLREDGLEHVIEKRAQRGTSTAPGREAYRRCAKSLLRVGADTAGSDRVLGMALEIVPEQDPTSGADPVSFRLLRDGRPCALVMVSARHRERPAHAVSTRTDEQGRVTFSFDAPGFWLVSGVVMEPAATGSTVDWNSFWASLSFERGVEKAP